MVRKFLYVIAVLTVLFLAGRLALTFWSGDLATYALVPKQGFEPQPPLAANAYDNPKLWFSRPGLTGADPVRFVPQGAGAPGAPLDAAVFFIHPTSYFDRAHWNEVPGDPQADKFAAMMIRGMASPFAASPDIWAPRYRQATMGAFLADRAEREPAINLAYADVRAAFHAFLAGVAPDQPIVLVGHSQGALLLKRLLRDEVAGKPLAHRIAVAYVIGWPVSLVHDLPLMGLPACTRASQPGCVVSWQTYAEPADPKFSLAAYARFPALDGKSPKGTPFLCTNPLDWTVGSAAPANANLGTLFPDAEMATGTLKPGMVPARCSPQGFLLIGPPPELGEYVLPGNNFHVYDIPLFWANLRANVAQRVTAWHAAQ